MGQQTHEATCKKRVIIVGCERMCWRATSLQCIHLRHCSFLPAHFTPKFLPSGARISDLPCKELDQTAKYQQAHILLSRGSHLPNDLKSPNRFQQ